MNSHQTSVNQTPNNTILNPNSRGVRQSKPCYKCGEKYFPGHQCKQKTLMALQGLKGDIVERDEEWHDMLGNEEKNLGEILPLNTIEGNEGEATIRVLGQ